MRRRTVMRQSVRTVAVAALALGAVCGGLSAGPASATVLERTGGPVVDDRAVVDGGAVRDGGGARTVSGASAAVAVQASAAEGDGDESLLGKADRLVEQLQEEPLVADDASADVYGSAFDELRQLQDDAAVQTYIVFDGELDYQQTTTMAQILAELLPGDEYVVLVVGESKVGPTAEAVAADEDRARLLRMQFSALGENGAQERSVLVRMRTGLERLADPQEVRYASSGNDTLRWLSWQVSSSPLRTLVVAVATIAIIAAALWFLVPRGAKRKRYRIPKAVAIAAAAADRQAMRRALGEDALDVVERLQELQTGTLDRETADLVEHGLDAYGLARRLADDEESREDDLAGAMVLMGIAETAVTHAEAQTGSGRRTGGRGARKGRAAKAPEPLCSLDPRHGPAKKEIDVSVAGRAGSLTVPACAKCLHDDRHDNPLRWLTVDGKPYVLRDTVWAATLYGGTEDDLVDAVVAARAKAS